MIILFPKDKPDPPDPPPTRQMRCPQCTGPNENLFRYPDLKGFAGGFPAMWLVPPGGGRVTYIYRCLNCGYECRWPNTV